MLKITVVIPCFKVRSHILDVLSRIGPEVSRIYVVDDCCPENSGLHVQQNCRDERVVVIRSASNQGVGGAVLTGYSAAIADGADIIVKIDGDGQMDPRLLPRMVQPILKGLADYTKGNRFYDLTHIRRMPTIRLIGNAILSFMSKLSTGYWKVLDPNNGYTAIDARLIAHLPLERISKRYFFETDMLFRLNILRAVVMDIPMDAIYADEQSNLRISRVIGEFLVKHVKNFFMRIFYNYFLRDTSLASLELLVGSAMLLFGLLFGCFEWFSYYVADESAPLGTIMLAALPVLSGLQFLLAFFSHDVSATPVNTIGEFMGEISAMKTKEN